MALGEEVGDAYISIHADTTKFRADLARLNRSMGSAIKRNDEYSNSIKRLERGLGSLTRHEKTRLAGLNKTTKATSRLHGVMGKLSGTFSGMDRTVRAVLIAIVSGAEPLAAIVSALGASIVALSAALAFAAGGLVIFLGAVLPLVAGLIPLIAALTEMEKRLPVADKAWNRLSDTFTNIAVPAFVKEWQDTLVEFFNILNSVASDTGLFSSLGANFAAVGDVINQVLGGQVFKDFIQAIKGDLGDAFVAVFSSIAPFLDVFLRFFTATAPIAKELGEEFRAWAEALATTFSAVTTSQAFQETITKMADALRSVVDFALELGEVLGALFSAGVDSGIELLNLFTDLLNDFENWMLSVEGQRVLEEWFDKGIVVMEGLLDFLGQVGEAFAGLISPDTIDDLLELLITLGTFIGLVSELLQLFAAAGIINLVATLLNTLGAAITPLFPFLEQLLGLLGTYLIAVLERLAISLPVFTGILADILTPILLAITPILDAMIAGSEELLPPLMELLDMFVAMGDEIFAALLPALMDITDQVVAELIPAFIDFSQNVLIPLIGILVQVMDLFVGNDVAFKLLMDSISAGITVMTFFLNFWSNVGAAITDVTKKIDVIAGKIGDFISKIGNIKLPSWMSSNIDFGGGFNVFAAGGITNGPVAIAGEAGREAIVPLERPLNMIDPSVRWLAAIAQGKGATPMAGGGITSGSVTVGEVNVITPATNPAVVASAVVDRIVAQASSGFGN